MSARFHARECIVVLFVLMMFLPVTFVFAVHYKSLATMVILLCISFFCGYTCCFSVYFISGKTSPKKVDVCGVTVNLDNYIGKDSRFYRYSSPKGLDHSLRRLINNVVSSKETFGHRPIIRIRLRMMGVKLPEYVLDTFYQPSND